MKKLILLFAILAVGCSKDEVKQNCDCKATIQLVRDGVQYQSIVQTPKECDEITDEDTERGIADLLDLGWAVSSYEFDTVNCR